MRKYIVLAFLVLFWLAVGMFARQTALRGWASVVHYTTPYHFADAEAGSRSPIAERAVLVIVDGLRLDASRRLSYLNYMRTQGADMECKAGTPSYSLPGRANLVTGAWPEVHGVTSNFYRKSATMDNLFRAAAKLHVSCAIAGTPEWKRMFGDDLARANATFFEALKKGKPGLYPEKEKSMQEVARQSIEFYKSQNPQFAIVEFLATDYAAHDFGASSDYYKQAAQWIDRMIEDLCREIDFGKTAVLVTSDHGHIAQGGHGGSEEEVLRTPLVAAGQGIKRGVKLRARQIDVAPTIAALLGLPIPAATQGRVLFDALQMDEAQRLALAQSQFQQKLRFARSYLTSLGVSEEWLLADPRVNESDLTALATATDRLDSQLESARRSKISAEREGRLHFFIALAVVPLLSIVYVLRSARTRVAEMRIIAMAVLVYFAIFYFLFVVGKLSFSISVINRDEALETFFLKDMIFALLAMAGSLSAAFLLARRSLKSEGLLPLCYIGFMVTTIIVYIIGAQIGFFYWNHGLFMRWHMADVRWTFTTFLNLLQVQAIGCGAVFIPALALIVTRLSNRSKPTVQ